MEVYKQSMDHYLEFFSFKNNFKTFCLNEQNRELNFRLNIRITRFIPQLKTFYNKYMYFAHSDS